MLSCERSGKKEKASGRHSDRIRGTLKNQIICCYKTINAVLSSFAVVIPNVFGCMRVRSTAHPFSTCVVSGFINFLCFQNEGSECFRKSSSKYAKKFPILLNQSEHCTSTIVRATITARSCWNTLPLSPCSMLSHTKTLQSSFGFHLFLNNIAKVGEGGRHCSADGVSP